MTSEFSLREYRSDDLPGLLQLIRCSVMQLACRHYTRAECRAWTAHLNHQPDLLVWDQHFSDNYTRLLLSDDDQLAAFVCVSLEHPGITADTAWLDCLFCAPRYAGYGFAGQLLSTAIGYARNKRRAAIETRASHCLAPLLKHKGWQHLYHETIEREDQLLETSRMRLQL